MLEATLIQTNSNGHRVLDLKIYDGGITHGFTIGEVVKHIVMKDRGEIVAIDNAEVIDLQAINDHIVSAILRTSALDFEIKLGPDYRYMAYKTLRYKE